MMNDRFSAQLRRHLLATANERPAEGQVAAIVERVAVTPQRGVGVGRLPWVPGRVGPFAPTAVRYALIAVALIIAIVGAALAAGIGPVQRTVFDGTWTSIDPVDGSTMTLEVGGGTSPALYFVDDVATGAACVADEVKVFTMRGSGTIVGDRLDVVWPDGGGCGLMKVEVGPGFYTFDQATDTITDGQGLTWTRVERRVVPPSRDPVTEPTAGPTASPTGPPTDADCVDLTNGGDYALRLGSQMVSDGSLRVTMTVPAAPLTPWQGSRDLFELSGVCQSDGAIDIRATIVTTVYADGCDTGGSGVAVTSYAEAVEQVAASRGHTTNELTVADRTIGGFPARVFAIDFDRGACGGIDLWNGAHLVDGSALAYLVDVDGVPLGILLRILVGPSLMLDERDEAETIVSSLRVETRLSPDATEPIALSDCTEFDQEATYTANVGSMPVSVTVPGTPGAPWRTSPGDFGLRKANCSDGVGLPLIHAALVDQVYADACHWKGSAVETPTAADVVAALQLQKGHDTVGPIETTLGPYAATRFDLSLQEGFDRGACDRDGLPWVKIWGDEILLGGGGIKRVYVADVDGVALVVTVGYYPDEITTTALDQVDAILATLRVGTPAT